MQLVREPVAAVGTLEGMRQALRVGERVAQVLPDERVELGRGDEAGDAGGVAMREHGLGLARADVVGVEAFAFARAADYARAAGGAAMIATDQGAQEIGVHDI